MEGTGLLAVARDLGLQLVEAGEGKVAAQAGAERDPHPPAILVAATLKQLKLQPLVVIDLAYHLDTPITRLFKDNVRLSRIYAEKVFNL